MSASAENKADMSWSSDKQKISYTFEDLVIDKDTDWIRTKGGEEIRIVSQFGFNPPCFTRKDDKGNIHVFCREYKIILGREPLRLIEKQHHAGLLPKHCTREQWNIQDDTDMGAGAWCHVEPASLIIY